MADISRLIDNLADLGLEGNTLLSWIEEVPHVMISMIINSAMEIDAQGFA